MSAIQLIGLGAVLGNLTRLRGDVRTGAGNGVMKAAYIVERYAKDEAPVRTGNLRRSITAHRTGPESARVETNERYAVYPETGTGRGWSALGAVAYMRRAVSEHLREIEDAVGGEVRITIGHS